MNKATKKTGIICLLIYLFSSCQKDLGNYSYSDLNEVTIAAIDSSYSALSGDRITISPQLSYAQNSDTTLFTYEWLYYGPTGGQNSVDSVVHTGIVLDKVFDFEAGSYNMYYRITEKSTGIIYTKFFNLAIGDLGYEGWLLLSDINGRSRLDMLNYVSDETFIPQVDILSAMQSNVSLAGSPISVNLGFHHYLQQLYVITSEEGYHLLQPSYETNISGYLYLPLSLLITGSAQRGFADARANMNFFTDYIYTNGGLYYRNPVYQGTVMRTVGPVNTNAANNRFSISPFFATTGVYNNAQTVMFNQDEKRMYRYQGLWGIISSPLIIDGLDMQHDDLIFMDYSTYNSGYVFAVFKDTRTNSYHLAQFTMNGTLALSAPLDGPDIADADLFTIDPNWGYLLYAANGKIYQYDLGTRRTALMQDYGERKISYLAFPKMLSPLNPSYFVGTDRYARYSRRLIVCTYDESNPERSGAVQFYTVPTLNRPFVAVDRYEGFGKIVSVVYNEK